MEKPEKTLLPKGVLTLRGKRLAGGRQSLYIDCSAGGCRRREYLSLYLLPEASPEARQANAATLRRARQLLRDRRTALLEAHPPGEAADRSSCISLDEWLLREIDRQRRRGIRSLGRLQSMRKRLLEYAPGVALAAVDKPFVARFIDYLRRGYRKADGAPLAGATLRALFGALQTLLDRAVGEGLLPRNPCRLFDPAERIRPGREAPRAWLTVDELKRLIATPAPKAAVRQIFLFGCFTGLRISDIRAICWRDLTGCGALRQLRVPNGKTRKAYVVPLARQALKWLPERGRQPADAPIFPVVPHDQNACIGRWARAAGITKHLTQHCARHTFATMLLTLGADIYTVSKLLGHTSLRNTQRYARIVDKRKDEAVGLTDRIFQV